MSSLLHSKDGDTSLSRFGRSNVAGGKLSEYWDQHKTPLSISLLIIVGVCGILWAAIVALISRLI